MKTIALLTSALVLLPLTSGADSPKVQLDKACQQARAAKKDVLLIFSGSQWHQNSKDFEAKVLKAEKFVEATSKDFVQALIEIPPTREEAHQELLDFDKTYQFRSIPTLILTDAQGRPYGNTIPAQDEELDKFIARLGELRKIRVERDKDFEAAQKAQGKEKAELIVKALKSLPQETIGAFYEAELVMIEKADPKNETGYAGEIRKAQAIAQEQARYNELFSGRKYDEIIKTSQAEVAKLQGEDAQRVKLYEVKALYAQRKYEEALREVNVLEKMAPDSELGKRSAQFSSQIQGAIEREKRMKEAAEKRKQPVVSKPVAIVTDIKLLQADAKKAEGDLAKALETEKALTKEKEEIAAKIKATQAELMALQQNEKASAEKLTQASAEREKLARKAQAMKEVVENHLAMEKRKREVSELEKKAVELQKQADDLRKKAGEIREGK